MCKISKSVRFDKNNVKFIEALPGDNFSTKLNHFLDRVSLKTLSNSETMIKNNISDLKKRLVIIRNECSKATDKLYILLKSEYW